LFSRNGKIMVAVLSVAIVVALLMPGKKGRSPFREPALPERPLSQTEMLMAELEGRSAPEHAPAAPAAQQNPVAQPAPAPPPPAAFAAASVIPADSEDFELLAERYGRTDPFAPLIELPSSVDEDDDDVVELPEISPLPPILPKPMPSLNLTAVAIRNGKGIAVINGKILRVGDDVAGYTVMKIAADRVELVDQLGDTATLRIRQETPPSWEVIPGLLAPLPDFTPPPRKKDSTRLSPVTGPEVWGYYGDEESDSAPQDRPPPDDIPAVSP